MTREERLTEIIEDHGIADEARAIRDIDLGRFLLLEADEGSADNGGPWYSTGDDWEFLLECSDAQEYAEDWPAELLIDLDSGAEYPIEQTRQSIISNGIDPPIVKDAQRKQRDGQQTIREVQS